jgi:hypothetical protein
MRPRQIRAAAVTAGPALALAAPVLAQSAEAAAGETAVDLLPRLLVAAAGGLWLVLLWRARRRGRP